jgi:osmotically-inducible protein OsmY
MNWTKRNHRVALAVALLAGAFLRFSLAVAQSPSPASSDSVTAQAGNPVASELAARLNKKQFHDVKVSVDQGTAILTGTVELYANKVEAEKRARKTPGITAVRDLIQVGGPDVSDQELQDKLLTKLTYDRVFYGNAFNAISLHVRNGTVILGGHALSPNSKDSALELVSYYPGVKGVVDEIQVDPLSMMDNRIRMMVFRAVYGVPQLSRYAMDPAKPIRISVQNGNVELYGVVESQSDKQIAFIRANAVPGVFSVKNFLDVVEAPAKAKK